MLVDTHCHLFMPPLRDDLEAVLRRALGAGVDEIVVPAFDLESWDSISAMSAHPMIHTALGLHPWKAEQVLDRDDLAAVLTSTGSVAIGEIGLDFKVSEAGRERQMLVLSTQLDLALELDLPVILHCRAAFQEMLDILSSGRYRNRLRGVLHAFTRSIQIADRFTELGFFLAFGGAVTRPRARRTRESAVHVPDEFILLETDSPAIGMENLSPGDTEPAHVARVAAAISLLRNDDISRIGDITTSNARRLFRLDG